MTDPYKKCPIYKTQSFTLRLVTPKDAKNLLECYSDKTAVRLMNSDNCTSDFYYTTLKQMTDCIDFWLMEYKNGGYVRFAIINNQTQKAIGTIEMFGRDGKLINSDRFGLLRIDICSDFESQYHISQLLQIAQDNFFTLFDIKSIITKAIDDASERLYSLKDQGYLKLPKNTLTTYNDYYIISEND